MSKAELPPIEINGITADQLAAWRHHPVTKVIMQLYADRQAHLTRACADFWTNGANPFGSESQKALYDKMVEARARVLELGDMRQCMEFSTLVNAYGSFEQIGRFEEEQRDKEANAVDD